MSLDATLRLLAKASGLTAADLAAAIPRAGVATVKSWLAGDKLPGRDQLNALARALGVPAGALLSELASTLTWRNSSPKPGISLSSRGISASGVESRPVKPVPPVTRMPSTAGSAIQCETCARRR